MGDLFVTSDRKALDYPYFPDKFIAVIWRNWETVPVENIAKALDTTVGNIVETAGLMGLDTKASPNPSFLKRGYLTVIRRNWHLLDYDQICTLLDITKDELFFILKEDDFMWHKMGNMKPNTGHTVYRPLTEEEKVILRKNAYVLAEIHGERYKENAFSFLEPYYAYDMTPIEKGDGKGFEIVLPDTVGYIYPEDNPWIDLYVKDFCRLMEKRMGIKAKLHESADFTVHIAIKDFASKKSGSYGYFLVLDTNRVQG
jgi:hypothetical protein